MNTADSKPSFRKGTTLTAASLQTLRNMIASLLIGDGKNIRVRSFGDRFIIEGIPSKKTGGAAGTTFKTFKVVEEKGDYINCQECQYGGTPSEVITPVAKPYLLRRTPFDGQTITYIGVDITYTYGSFYTSYMRYSARSGYSTEAQYITPPYFVGEFITAFKSTTGVVTEGEGASVIWEDVNTGARAWASQGYYGD